MSRGQMKDLAGQRFGRLLVVAPTSNRTTDRHVIWECKCDCGNICFVQSNSLVSGKTQSCGCFMEESRGKSRIKHHMSGSKIYDVWSSMRLRCFNEKSKDYKDYGGRGITVCEEWKNDFQAFFDYVSKLPHFGEKGYSIDRIDNDCGYTPGNVRWATMKEQANNRRVRNRRDTDDYIE